MMTCTRARETIVGSVRRSATEGSLLALEAHLAECAACRAERERYALLDHLRGWEPPSLSTAARRRVLERLVAAPVTSEVPLVRRRGLVWPVAVGLAAAAGLALYLGRAHAPRQAPAAAST